MNKTRIIVYGAFAVFILFVLACMGMEVLIEVPLTLAFGWLMYAYRTFPHVSPSPAGVATGVLCLAGFAFGSHAFLTWLYRELRGPDHSRWRAKWTARLVTAIVLMFVAGLASAGVAHQVGWLVTSPEPWTSGVQLAARRAQSTNNLKQIGLAVHGYAAGENRLPPGATAGEFGALLHSWQTLILPFMENAALWDRVDRPLPWDDPANAEAFRSEIPVFLMPGVKPTRDDSGSALSHYEGNARVVGGTRGLRLEDVTDGTSNTILAGESAGGYQPWGKPGHWRDPADGINRSPDRGFGGPSPGGASILMLDGSVKFIKNTISPSVLKALGTPAGGEVVHSDSY